MCSTLELPFFSEQLTCWIAEQRARGDGKLLAAESTLALAEVGEVDFSEVDRALSLQPVVFAPWYLMSLGHLARRGTERHVQRSRAIRSVSPFNRLLLRLN